MVILGKYIVFTFFNVKWRCFKIAIRGEKGQPINNQIRAAHMLVIGPGGEQLGKKTREEAFTLASYAGFDLVQINEKDGVAVCKLMDYNKYRYEKKKKQKESHKRQKENNAEMKEYRLSINIDTHDQNTKEANIRKYLVKGHKIKLSIRFRGREMQHTNLGRDVLKSFSSKLSDVSEIEQQPLLDGKNMILILGPKK